MSEGQDAYVMLAVLHDTDAIKYMMKTRTCINTRSSSELAMHLRLL